MTLRFLYIFIYLRLFNDVNNTSYNFNFLNLSKKKDLMSLRYRFYLKIEYLKSKIIKINA